MSGAPKLLEGRAAVVTGSSRGIGRAVALALAAEGAAVVVNGRESGPVHEAVACIEDAGGRARPHVGSVADFRVAGELVQGCVDAFGSIDVLVNCAGVGEPDGASILDLAPEAWREVVDSHLTSTFNTCRHAAPRMVARGRGAIVNTSSHAWLGLYGGSAYPAAKGGTNSLGFAMAAELREHGIRVNAVCPGARTRLSTGPAYETRIRDLHRRGILDDGVRDASLAPRAPEHVAPLYLFLASDRAAGISGRLFSAAGGYVGVQAAGGESLLAYRDPDAEGPWPVDELAERIAATLPAP